MDSLNERTQRREDEGKGCEGGCWEVLFLDHIGEPDLSGWLRESEEETGRLGCG